MLVLSLLVVLCGCSKDSGKTDSVIWDIDNLQSIGGNKPTVLGAPIAVDTPEGGAIQFDGEDDALILDTNPLAGFSQFTIEIVFRPDAGGNREQRFFHVQEKDDHRVLIEIRLTDDSWFLDTFIKSGTSEKTLYAQEFPHPLGNWYHAALVYEAQQMRHYVNGVQEMDAPVNYVPMKDGQTSIGCRLNRVFWFKGAIRQVRVTPRALSPEEFLPL
ncbi:LamG domain-containing protein [Acidobacteria bacterium AH-259-A15]|nr:LamG domain-containing protein [Acidobacteria bacterium AH-259-A15]